MRSRANGLAILHSGQKHTRMQWLNPKSQHPVYMRESNEIMAFGVFEMRTRMPVNKWQLYTRTEPCERIIYRANAYTRDPKIHCQMCEVFIKQ